MEKTTGEIIQKSYVRHGFMGVIDTVITLKQHRTKRRIVLTVPDEEKAQPFGEGDLVEVDYDNHNRLQSITRLTSLAHHYAESYQ